MNLEGRRIRMVMGLRRAGVTDARVLGAMERVEREHPAAANTTWWAWVRRPFGMPIEGVAVAAVALLVLAVVGLPGEAPPTDLDLPEYRDVPPSPEGEAAPAAVKLPALPEKEVPAEAPEAKPEAGGEGMGKSAPAPAPAPEPSAEADVPDETVAAEGTDEDPAAAPPLRSVPNGYDLFTEDVSALRSLLALVGRLGGEVTDLDGNPVTSAEMTSSRRDVKITLPQASLNEFQSQIASLGVARPTFDDDRLLSSATVELQVGIQLSGGGVGTGDGDKPGTERRPAPKKRMMEFDEMAEPSDPMDE